MAKMKKITMVVRYFYPVMAGIENHVYEVAKRLVKSGWNVVVYTSKDTLEKRNALRYRDVLDGIKIRRFNSFFELVKRLDYDAIIYINNFNVILTFLIFIRAILRKMIGKENKIVLVPHGGYTPWRGKFPLLIRIIKMIYHKIFGKFFINHTVSKVIAVSEWEKNQLIAEGIRNDLIVVIPNGIEDWAFRDYEYNAEELNIQLSNKKYLVTLSRISREKNIDGIIKALSHFEDLDLVVCGYIKDRRYYNYLKDLARKLGLRNRIHFVGYVQGKDKYYFVDNAEAFILVSWFETDPLSVKEAMARGKILIVSNRGALPYIVKDGINGFVANPNEKSIADGIKKAITLSGEERQKIAEENVKESRKYNWDEVTERIINLLKNL